MRPDPAALRVARPAVSRYGMEAAPTGPRGDVGLADGPTSRTVAARMNAARPSGSPSVQAGDLAALSLLHEISHLLVERYEATTAPGARLRAVDSIQAHLGADAERALGRFAEAFPARLPGPEDPASLVGEMLLTHVANENPAATPMRELFDDRPLAQSDAYSMAIADLEAFFAGIDPPADTDPETTASDRAGILDLLRAPARHAPTSLAGQLRYVREHWSPLLGDDLGGLLDRIETVIGVMAEEERGLHRRFGGGGGGARPAEAPEFTGLDAEVERFSSDADWMPRLVLVAKSTYVWLDQLSKRYARDIRTLDGIPDEELDLLRHRGITGLWLIGLWQRSPASQTIKRRRGNPDAVASAYSLDDYRIADDLGGEGAYASLRDRARERGIRLASDMVPNHMGIDSHWVIEHPEWFLSVPEPPYPAYSFGGPDLSPDGRTSIVLEDHYWDATDAAVVFKHHDHRTGATRYIYHGNDGTSFPWNDTAQLDFISAEVREQVIRTILDVARRFPVIRFDAAMVLARRHVQRLWWPLPGAGDGIPSRAEHALRQAAFDRLMPGEFWREVVDRVAAEVPDTLLLAEAFWMLEGYFVRTLGMHRVYNSAFMHMLRDEDNAGYRKVLKETLEFDPEILKRYVNFMNNPDEKTAVEQFGKGDKYVGVATLLATLPGLPMFGHGQFEGFTEKYGMEFRRASLDEAPDEWLVGRHEREIVPLLHRRGDFAEARDFLLYDLAHDAGGVDENVFAYSNGSGASRSLVVYNNRYGETSGWIRDSAAFAVKDDAGSKRLEQRSLADGLALADGSADDRWLVLRDQRTSLEFLRSVAEVRELGLHVQLRAYETRVFWQLRELHDPAGIWRRLSGRIGEGGVPSLEDALRDQQLAPVHDTIRAAINEPTREGTANREAAARVVDAVADATGTSGDRAAVAGLIVTRYTAAVGLAEAIEDRSQAAALQVWALLAPLGSLPSGAMAGPTSRAWYEELRLAPVVADALRGRGLDEGAAWWAAERVRMLLDLPLPSSLAGPAETLPLRLVDAWISHPAVRPFIRVNAWDGVEWFHRESWDELLVWTDRLEWVLATEDGRTRRPISHSALERTLTAAADASGYRVDRLRQALGAPAAPPPGTGAAPGDGPPDPGADVAAAPGTTSASLAPATNDPATPSDKRKSGKAKSVKKRAGATSKSKSRKSK